MSALNLRKLKQAAQSRRPKGDRWFGLLGDFDDVIHVPSRSGWRYVRVDRPGGYEVGKYRSQIALADVPNAPVILEQDPLTGERFIVAVDQEMVEAAEYDGADLRMSSHAETHDYGGRDQLNWLHVRQVFWPSRIQIKAAETVRIQAGAVPLRSEGYTYTVAEDLDLSSYCPGSGTKYVLIYLTEYGEVRVGDNSATRLDELQHAPSGALGVAAIRLRTGQSLTWDDVIDLRMIPLPGAREFTDLSDTPDDYDGYGGQVVAVSPGENELEFLSALTGLELVTSGSFSIQLTNTLSGITQYNSQTVTFDAEDVQDDTSYYVWLTAEDSAAWFAVTNKTTADFEIYVYGQAPSGTLEPTVRYWVIR